MKTRVIFASLILGLGLATSQANAATTTNTDDSPAANKPASVLLVNGSQKLFASYVEHNVAKLANTTNWQNFMSIVSLYNQNPVAMLDMSAADKAKFNESVTQVTNKLAQHKDATANNWVNQAKYTARMINFLWDANQATNQAADIQ